MVTLKQTIDHIAADYRRRLLLQCMTPNVLTKAMTWLHPFMVSVLMYRLSRFCVYNRMRWISNMLVIIEHVYTKNEISPLATIGPGLVINGSGIGIVSNVSIGANCTFMGRNVITLGGMENFDLNRDRIEIGDYCVFATGSRVIRPVSLAAGTQIMPNAVVLSDEQAPGSTISGIPAKPVRQHPLDIIKHWSPLQGKRMSVVGA